MAETRGSRLLIVGCGQLGSRHLQAVSTLSQVTEIEVVDPRAEALALGQERLAEVLERNSRIRYRWLPALEEATPGGELCIVATQAQPRCQLVQEVAETLGYTAFLLEKLVAQSVQELDGLVDFSRQRQLAVWVNCKTRAYPFHKHAKQRVQPGEPLLMNVTGGNHGLANNGIHAADLFVFYDGADAVELVGSRIDSILHRSKRGEGVFDLSGTLQGATAHGSHFTLSYAGDHAQSEQIAITTRRYRCIVDQLQRWAVESDPTTGWAWRPIPFEGNLAVSQMTKEFASDILISGRCALPMLEEAEVAHRFILSALQPHFSRLFEKKLDCCPVT